jgi:hypothetical protein
LATATLDAVPGVSTAPTNVGALGLATLTIWSVVVLGATYASEPTSSMCAPMAEPPVPRVKALLSHPAA